MLGRAGVWTAKINALIATAVGGKYVRTTRFASIGAGTSGSVTLPSNSSVVLDDFGGTVDAIIVTLSGGKPTQTPATTSLGAVVSTTFDSSGNWVLSAAPSSYPVGIVYRVQQTLQNFTDTAADIWGEVDFEASPIIYGSGGNSGYAVNLAPNGYAFTPAGLLVSTDLQNAINENSRYNNGNPLNYSWLFDDVIGGGENAQGYGQLGLEPTGSAGGGIFTPSNFAGSLAGRFGVTPIGLGTNSNSTANGVLFNDLAICYASQNTQTILYFGVYVPSVLSDNTNYYIMDLGFRNSINTGVAANTMSIRYDQGVSPQWFGVTSNASTATNTTTAAAACTVTAGAYWDFKIVIAAGSVSFYCAAAGQAYTLIGTSTTHLPDSTHTSYLGFMIYRSSSFALQRLMGVDYVGLYNNFGAQR